MEMPNAMDLQGNMSYNNNMNTQVQSQGGSGGGGIGGHAQAPLHTALHSGLGDPGSAAIGPPHHTTHDQHGFSHQPTPAQHQHQPPLDSGLGIHNRSLQQQVSTLQQLKILIQCSNGLSL